MRERIQRQFKTLARLAAPVGAAALLVACNGERPSGTVGAESALQVGSQPDQESSKIRVKIGEVQMEQLRDEVKVVTREHKTARKVEVIIDEECYAQRRLTPPHKSIVFVYQVGDLRCIVSSNVLERIKALQS